MLFLAGTNQKVLAQNSNNVTLAASVGFGGNCKTDLWVPIQVRVENKGAEDLDGQVRFAYKNSQGGETAYGTEISLPANSRKEFFLYAYYDGYLDKPKITFMVRDQVVVEKQLPLTCMDSESLIIGLITDTPNAFSGLTSLSAFSASSNYTRIALLKLNNLPDRSEGWSALDALVISGVDTSSLSESQKAALKSWLAQGGKLLVTGGPKWQEIASGLGALLPLNLNTTQSVDDLSSLQNYLNPADVMEKRSSILAVGQVRANATILVSQGNIPILAKSQVGFGNVYYLAADPSLEPLSTWDGMNILYQSLLQGTSVHATWMTSKLNAYGGNQALAALPALGLPSAIYVFCLLGIYILVIGPINYIVLRAIKRQEWAWVTIPTLVMAFTIAAYLSGFWIRGARPILNRLAVVQAWDNVDQAEARGLVGIYSPGRTRYTLQAGAGFLSSPFDNNTQALQSNQGWLSLQHGTETLLPDVIVEASGMKSAVFQGIVPALAFTHTLTLNLSDSNPIIQGNIKNTSKYAIKDAELVTGDARRSLGDFAPGETKQIQIGLRTTAQGAVQIYDTQQHSVYSYYSNTNVDEKEIRQSALMAAFLSDTSSYRATSGQVTSGIYLTGWVEGAILSTAVQGQGFDTLDTTFYILNLNPVIKTNGTSIKLTPGLFTWSSSNINAAPYPLVDYPGDVPDQYILNFKLAAPVHYTSVKSLSLTLGVPTYGSSTSAFSATNTAAIWDWQKSSWVQVNGLVWGVNDIADPSPYIGPEGTIRLKISKNGTSSQSANPVGSSYFTMVVQP